MKTELLTTVPTQLVPQTQALDNIVSMQLSIPKPEIEPLQHSQARTCELSPTKEQLIHTIIVNRSERIKSVKFNADEFEELCFFSRELPPSEIPLSPVYTTEDDLIDLTAADMCFGASHTMLSLTNFFTAAVFTSARKSMSRVASVKIDAASCVVGMVEVKNVAFHKIVSVRFTLDDWKTFGETDAVFAGAIAEPQADCAIDQFAFKICAKQIVDVFIDHEKSTSTALNQPQSISFAVCYKVNGEAHWDSNNGQNYTIELRRQFIKSKPIPLLSSSNYKKPPFAAPEISKEKLEKLIKPFITSNAFRAEIASQQNIPAAHFITQHPVIIASPHINQSIAPVQASPTIAPYDHLINMAPFLTLYTPSQTQPAPKQVKTIVKCSKATQKSIVIPSWISGKPPTPCYTSTSQPAYTHYPHSFSNSNINDYGLPYDKPIPTNYATDICGYARLAYNEAPDMRRVEDNGMNGTRAVKAGKAVGMVGMGGKEYEQWGSLYANSDYLNGMSKGSVATI